ncbi:MAG: GNAT family N-acetyltransferase [Pyrinomonadaceae bacterium]
MQATNEQQLIEYSVYTDQDEDEMVQLLGDVFSRRDPPAVAVGLVPSEFEDFVRLFCPKAALEGVTIVARNASTRQLVGALLAEDCAAELPEGMDRLSPKFEPIFDILGQLDTDYRATRTPRHGESLHLFLVGVAESVAGQGVAHQLVSRCLENGAGKGYQLAVTEATNKVSQHIFRKLGFTERVHRSYSNYRFNGRAVFESIADQGGPILMDKSLLS